MSLALKKLRRKYDDIHKMTKEKEADLEKIKVSNRNKKDNLFKFYYLSLKKIERCTKDHRRRETGREGHWWCRGGDPRSQARKRQCLRRALIPKDVSGTVQTHVETNEERFDRS